jgi:hypothetical protein
MRYYFDTLDGDQLIEDDEGIEVATLAGARRLAAESLAELAADRLPGAERRQLSVVLRTAAGPVWRAGISFEAAPLL